MNFNHDIKHNLIIIEGNIGAGKTTLTNKIGADLNSKIVLEKFADNPFLPKFYYNKEKYAFQVELAFLADRYKQIKQDLEQQSIFNNNIISDYYLMKSFIFARINLKDDEFNLYRNFFDLIRTHAIKPDILVYIHRNVDTLIKNINKRGRDFERNMEPDYLLEIQKGYFNYFREEKKYPIVIIDADKIDFKDNDNYNKLLKILSKEYKNGVTNVNL